MIDLEVARGCEQRGMWIVKEEVEVGTKKEVRRRYK
jgi:hypothetical protein